VVCAGGGNTLHLARIDVDGSNYRVLASPVTNGLPVWSRDGRWIYFAQPEQNSRTSRVVRVAAEGGQPEFTGISIDDLHGFDLSPDGAKIAYSGGSKTLEVWALDKVLSLAK